MNVGVEVMLVVQDQRGKEQTTDCRGILTVDSGAVFALVGPS
jgi:hypothetical protein